MSVLFYNPAMAFTLRSYEPHDFAALHKLDQACFVAGISYSRTTLRYFFIAGFVLSEENPPLAHIITLDVAEKLRRNGIGTALLQRLESNLSARGVRSVLLETAIDNEAAVAFWQRHGYRIEATLKRYYLGRLDAYAMRKRLQPPVSRTDARSGEKY
ncbi:MAG: hypothetical protein AUG46_11120 [Acidobacteria bacterium 13_1_20CM_3_58_11]|nr:MAG: hypothetical protein AUG46_11120 [Acidobacteria bacterium 13_1_20CM_3_58_11]